MSNLCVFTTVESEASAALLRRSCQRVGINLHLYETGNWKGYADGKIRGALEFLRTRSEEVCMFVDGHDSFILEPAEEILCKFKEFLEPVVISCEKTCWPDSSIYNRYPVLLTASEWIWPNSGGWIGFRKSLIEVLAFMVNFTETWPNDDQRCWHEYCTHPWATKGPNKLPAVDRDAECDIFQTMGGTGELDETGRNTITGNWPTVWHFNGRTPGREEWYTKLTGDKL